MTCLETPETVTQVGLWCHLTFLPTTYLIEIPRDSGRERLMRLGSHLKLRSGQRVFFGSIRSLSMYPKHY